MKPVPDISSYPTLAYPLTHAWSSQATEDDGGGKAAGAADRHVRLDDSIRCKAGTGDSR